MGHELVNKRVAFYTLGCKLNFTETSTIAREFEKRGYQTVESNEVADVCVINTCTVTLVADKKSRQAIKKLIRQSPHAKIIVVGCYAQLKGETLSSIEGVDLVLGNHEKFALFEYIDNIFKPDVTKVSASDILAAKEFHLAYSMDDRTRSFLKVQDGCDYYCSYCTVPFARGHSRNCSIKEIIKTANIIAQKGIKEVVLTGINLGDFGKTTGEPFMDLLLALEGNTDVERYRISSIEPNLLTEEIVAFVNSSSKFMPHFHLPLQAGSDRILEKMQRRYTTSLFKKRVETILKYNEQSGIGVDVIVGFPGETEEDFTNTYSLLEHLDVSYLHVFTYSDREKTKAFKFKEKVDPKTKLYRSKQLLNLSDLKKTKFYQKQLDKEYEVLFEATDNNGFMEGFTENYIRTEYQFNPKYVGKIFKTRLKNISETGNVRVDII